MELMWGAVAKVGGSQVPLGDLEVSEDAVVDRAPSLSSKHTVEKMAVHVSDHAASKIIKTYHRLTSTQRSGTYKAPKDTS